MITILTWTALGCGLISAALWWASSYFSIETVKSLDNRGGDGDIALQIEPGKFMVFRNNRVARINSLAALFAGLAIAAQALMAVAN
ncbi:hypothetical protein LB534_28205 [Mesorhizobium sp. CA18]|uniref:hypothetical protein n=1 Tax=unclassified Mesorhizobium TaxID=325217 RepID=UPI001CCA8D1E|nr:MULTISPECIES: hypothetical protein [unclassified Mesorhizobium]MBZ9736343.1 hypothetical protein [Mesorhizobium sp. CA9]MBZ9829179.1 hypothetical protein [Mesorhizobium sp. CA18]MBZ9833862.1 hypothetical protein [Mesorhizobium sp. CA2]MBZ9840031.1 hypothetical protein [Mesorhizobium sp. CA3]MBZ9880210.1 hypothetical protein [Mesorhizobium sp. Ca11]